MEQKGNRSRGSYNLIEMIRHILKKMPVMWLHLKESGHTNALGLEFELVLSILPMRIFTSKKSSDILSFAVISIEPKIFSWRVLDICSSFCFFLTLTSNLRKHLSRSNRNKILLIFVFPRIYFKRNVFLLKSFCFSPAQVLWNFTTKSFQVVSVSLCSCLCS